MFTFRFQCRVLVLDNAAKNQITLEGATLYVTLSPCLPCARIIYTTGIKKVIFLNSYAKYKGIENEEGVDFLTKFGVTVVHYQLPISQ